MPAFTLEATAEGANTAWTASAGTKVNCVSDADDGTYIYISGASSPGRQSFAAQDLPADAVGITAPVTCNARGKDGTSTADLIYSHFRYGGGNYEDGTGWNFSTSVAAYARDWATGPGGGAWTIAMLNACEIGVYRAGSTNTVWVTKYNVTGNYIQAGACFLPIWSLLLPLLGAGIALPYMPRIALEMGRRPLAPGLCRVRFRPDEYASALRSLRDWRRPAFAFLGAPALV